MQPWRRNGDHATVPLTGPAQVATYLDRATTGTGPQALAPAHVAPSPARPPTAPPTMTCAAARAASITVPVDRPDTMQARAILRLLAQEVAISSHALSAA
ncbi:hypothetical protein ACFWB2_20915 [Streptomyces virginiae]|uniref:hypothetical protein n=1 Tax=Streptomyces virginiae TaxID=1961 RepID=UPI0036CF7120